MERQPDAISNILKDRVITHPPGLQKAIKETQLHFCETQMDSIFISLLKNYLGSQVDAVLVTRTQVCALMPLDDNIRVHAHSTRRHNMITL
jgi:hypothetical protein